MPHKYAIDARLLGDEHELAWTNLGDWSQSRSEQPLSYPQACENLARRLADRLNLTSNDRVLDLGCGQGASLRLWQAQYQIQQLEAVELQAKCVEHIEHYLSSINAIHQLNFLNLKSFEFKKFDVVLCIDAAYHTNLNSFLSSVNSVLNSKARVGFHTLIWSEQYLNSNFWQRQKYRYLLKAADVKAEHLRTAQQTTQLMQQFGFEKTEIEDLSEAVLAGFANYIEQRCPQQQSNWNGLKIAMTAKLCRKLYAEGLLRYVQITATAKT